MPEPGARISHAAVAVAAQVGCPVIWVGEAGVRVYSEASPGQSCLMHQARSALDPDARLSGSQDVRHAIRRTGRRSAFGRSATRNRWWAREADVPGAGPATWGAMEAKAVPPGRLGSRDPSNHCLIQATACLASQQ